METRPTMRVRTPLTNIRGYLEANRRAKEWDGPVKEITFEKLEKDGKVFDIELHSRIDAPIDTVWAAMKAPEKLAEFSDQYKKSELLAQTDENKTVQLETLQSTLADIEGSYHIEPSPDGTKTLYIYKATQTDKIALPISTDVQRSALKESFVNQVNAIKKQAGIS